jgi:hypothetical protein
MSAGADESAKLPTIHVRRRWLPPLVLCLIYTSFVVIFLVERYHERWSLWFTALGLTIFGSLAVYSGWYLLDRRPVVTIRHDGVDVAGNGTGFIRWHEIIHIECFRVQEQGAVALFVTEEALARLPPFAPDENLPVLVNCAFSGPPIWFSDGPLAYSAREIADELIARQRGVGGCLTARRRRDER